MVVLAIIFWLAILVLFHVFLFYPLVLWAISKFNSKPVDKDVTHQAGVSILIAAYNEEQGIEKKLRNLQSQRYPAELVEIIVISDGSTDATDDICQRYADNFENIYFYRQPSNQGKTAAMNRAVEMSSNRILIFTDADNILSEDAVSKLVANFNDPSVGSVCGKLSFYSDTETGTATSGGFYWKYNQFMRTLESLTGSTMGANGALFAVRREIFRPLEPYLIDDFSTSMNALFKGYRIVFENDAIAYAKHTTDIDDENRRRKRIGNRVCTAIQYFWDQILRLNPLNFFKFLSHKLFRYYTLFFMASAFLTNLLLIQLSPVYQVLFTFQLLFYLLALGGYLFEKIDRSPKLFYIPYYFCTMNYYQFLGAFSALRGDKHVTWNTNNSSR